MNIRIHNESVVNIRELATFIDKKHNVNISNVDLANLCDDLIDAREEVSKYAPILHNSKPFFHYCDTILQPSDDGKKMFMFNDKTAELIKVIDEVKSNNNC